MVGRKRAIDKATVYEVFADNRSEIVEENKVISIKQNETIWKQIHDDHRIKKRMTVAALYTEALKWYKEISSNEDISPVKTIEKKIKDISLELSQSGDETADSDTDFNENESVDFSFSFTLSYEVWQTIQPVPKQYERRDKIYKTQLRTYHVLPPGLWTNVLVEKIAQHRKNIICTWVFKRAKVYMGGENYVTLSATCSTCRAYLVGYVSNEPKPDEMVKFTFKVINFNEEAHESGRKNVRIGGKKAGDLFKSKEIASVLRRKEVTASGAKMFDQPKGRDVTENAIRCGQYRYRQSQKLSSSPIQALEYMKESNTHGPSIHWISTTPFSIIYGSANQFVLYNAYRKANSYTKLCMDGTASLVHKIGK